MAKKIEYSEPKDYFSKEALKVFEEEVKKQEQEKKKKENEQVRKIFKGEK